MKIGARELFDQTLSRLKSGSAGERTSLIYWLLEDGFGINKTSIVVNESVEVDWDTLQSNIERVNGEEPIQQVLGFAWFRGKKFFVNRKVLIPRPETEELIDHVKKITPVESNILDLGTGSGCIAVSLALEIPQSKVVALDISEEALEVARRNAGVLNARVDFHLQSMLTLDESFLNNQKFDTIVSNPPYVREGEKAEMERNVLDFEPHLALFVSDKDPLIFYRAIAEIGLKRLKPGGNILAEINSYLGEETRALFKEMGYGDVCILQDFYGKDRFVQAKLA